MGASTCKPVSVPSPPPECRLLSVRTGIVCTRHRPLPSAGAGAVYVPPQGGRVTLRPAAVAGHSADITGATPISPTRHDRRPADVRRQRRRLHALLGDRRRAVVGSGGSGGGGFGVQRRGRRRPRWRSSPDGARPSPAETSARQVSKNTPTKVERKPSFEARSSAVQRVLARSGAVQRGPARTSAVQSSPARSSAVQRGPARSTAVQRGAARSSAVQRGPARSSAVQRGQARSSAVQRGPARSSAVQRGPRSRAAIKFNLPEGVLSSK